MGFIALLKSWKRVTKNGAEYAEGIIDGGGVTLKTSPHFSAPGDDSHPLIGDHPIAVSIPQRGGAAIVGYVDPKNAGITDPGEVRRYARNADGEIQGSLWLQDDGTNILSNDEVSLTQFPDGSFELTNGPGLLTLEAGGDFVINGVRFSPGGIITQVTSLKDIAAREYVPHVHGGVTTGPSSSGPNL